MERDTLRHILFLFIASLLAVLLIHLISDGVRLIRILYDAIEHGLVYILPGAGNQQVLRQFLGLTLTPLVIAIVPAAVYGLIRRRQMPGFFILLWGVWLILLALLAKA